MNKSEQIKIRTERAHKVDFIADELVRRFNAEGSRKFFCKVAWNLSESQIWSIYGSATKPGIACPIKYFVRACKNLIG